jgi:imidazolonepropionase-like amidohydrolase
MLRRCLPVVPVIGLLLLVAPFWGAERDPLRPTVFAVRNARVVVEPGKVLPKATVVVRDGLIEEVGADVEVPADALVTDGKGLTVYAGFLDAMSNWGFDLALRRSAVGDPAAEDLAAEALAATKPDNRKGVTPEFEVSTALKADDDKADTWRRLGFTAHLVAPDGGILVGQSALVSLSGAPPREAVLRAPVAQHAALRPVAVAGSDYPRVLMGVVAHARQTLLDAGHYHRAVAAFEAAGHVGRRPPFDPSLAALTPALEGKQFVFFDADTRDAIHRALDFASEFKMKPILLGGRDAWKAVDRLKQENINVVLRLDFTEGPRPRRRGFGGPPATPTPAPGTPATPGGRRNPATPGPVANPANQPEETPELPKRVKDDEDRKHKEEEHNAAVLREKGVLFAFSTQGIGGDRPADKFRENLRKAITAGLKPDDALRALTLDAARILGVEKQLGSVTAGKAAHLVVTDGDFHEAATKVRYVFCDGVRFEYDEKLPDEKTSSDKKEAKTDKTGGPKAVAKADDLKKPKTDLKKDEKPAAKDPASEIDADRKPKTHTGGDVLIRNATVLTVSNGTLAGADVLMKKGKIAEIGKGLEAPKGVTVVDATGLFLMPGIIDTHCHFAVEGGVNEFSLSVVPEVRVRDVVEGEDVQIYRSLAGGVTTARLLHGSANVIGGQDAVIKCKYGRPARELILHDSPRGVKFALGENVKRTDGRFPNTRLGVEAVLIRAFTEAQDYRKRWEAYEKARAEGKSLPEPRRDLRLEALADILKSDLRVHCHCYRADEILMLLRVADRFGFKIRSLQHVLEGYKIAPEIAEHGASCSPFSDWWAYKIEAYDAIPHNAALLTEAGVSVCLKSDSNELMRHLYQEAAKVVKYGGLNEAEALKTITLNGAKQLGLDKRIGSIEVGKDADLVLFSGHPLNSYSRPEMTLIDGEVYFQRSDRLKADSNAAAAPAKPTADFKPIPQSPTGSYSLENVTVHTAQGKIIEIARVYVHNGKIESIDDLGDGQPQTFPKLSGQVSIDAKGLHLYPGMIDAATVLGLTELGSARETQDFAEGGDFQPDLRASTAINPDSELIPVTRANGVTAVVTRPAGSIVAGQSALINLAGWVPREMAVVDPLALHIEFPASSFSFASDPGAPFTGRALARKQREEKLHRLKELFQQALVYDDGRKKSADKPVNTRLEALVPYARGQKPVVIQANRQKDIVEALKFADELKLKVILNGAIDAWKVADELKKRRVPVICGPILALPGETYDPYDAPYACPAKLYEAGIPFCIRSGGSTNTRNLPYEAAMAASFGLPPEEALKAVTLYPAQILGVEKELGSISTGKRANLVLTNGDILQASTQVLALFIDGKPLPPTSKHTRLYERYRERLHDVKAGKAPLGTK